MAIQGVTSQRNELYPLSPFRLLSTVRVPSMFEGKLSASVVSVATVKPNSPSTRFAATMTAEASTKVLGNDIQQIGLEDVRFEHEFVLDMA